MPRVYYINYIDAKTGFLRREAFNTNRDMRSREAELKRQGVTNITMGSFQRD